MADEPGEIDARALLDAANRAIAAARRAAARLFEPKPPSAPEPVPDTDEKRGEGDPTG
jgi:hypothetical protein